jgi:hypothetical protein
VTVREATALMLLYRACEDEALRRKVATLVPELPECAGEVERPPPVKRPYQRPTLEDRL